MRDPDLTTLRLFVSVCETQSLTRAAELANIVPSAISKRLAQLEQSVGTPILTRRRRGLEPTAAGLTLLDHARGMLASTDRLASDMRSYVGGVRGQVRVLATTSMMMESLVGEVASFLQQPAHADIQINIEERISLEIIRGLKEGSASLGFCWDVADLGGLQSVTYRYDHLAAVMHASHPLAHATSLQFADLLDHPHASVPVGSALQSVLQRAAALAGKPMVTRVIVSSLDAALRVVHANLALAVVPIEATQPFAEACGLRAVPLRDAWARRRFVVCFRDEQALSPAARLLRDHLVAHQNVDARQAA